MLTLRKNIVPCVLRKYLLCVSLVLLVVTHVMFILLFLEKSKNFTNTRTGSNQIKVDNNFMLRITQIMFEIFIS